MKLEHDDEPGPLS